MDYFVVEGYKEAAETFAAESKTTCKKKHSLPNLIEVPQKLNKTIKKTVNINTNLIGDRVEVRKLIQTGEIDGAIGKINDLNPEVYYFYSNSPCIFLIQKN